MRLKVFSPTIAHFIQFNQIYLTFVVTLPLQILQIISVRFFILPYLLVDLFHYIFNYNSPCSCTSKFDFVSNGSGSNLCDVISKLRLWDLSESFHLLSSGNTFPNKLYITIAEYFLHKSFLPLKLF